MKDQHDQDDRPHRESRLAFLAEHHRAVLADHCLSHRERRRVETREEILDAARDIYAESGARRLLTQRDRPAPRVHLGGSLPLLRQQGRPHQGARRARHGRPLPRPSQPCRRSLPPDERVVEMGMAYLDFARANPHDIALVALHESLRLTHAAGHAGLEELVHRRLSRGRRPGHLRRRVRRGPGAHGLRRLVARARHGRAACRQPPNRRKHLRPARQRWLLQVFVDGLKARLGRGLGPRTVMFAGDRRIKLLTLGAMCFALFMAMLDNTVVNVALPRIQRTPRLWASRACSGSSMPTPWSLPASC